MAKEAITPPISPKKKIDTVNKIEKPKASKTIGDTPRNNKTDKVKSIDKSWSTPRTGKENTVDKSRSISRTNLSNKTTRILKPLEKDDCKVNLIVSVLSRHGESLSSVTPDQQRIPRKNKRKTPLETLVIRKEPI